VRGKTGKVGEPAGLGEPNRAVKEKSLNAARKIGGKEGFRGRKSFVERRPKTGLEERLHVSRKGQSGKKKKQARGPQIKKKNLAGWESPAR